MTISDINRSKFQRIGKERLSLALATGLGRPRRRPQSSECPQRDLVLGVSFQLTNRKNYGHAATLDDAKAAFRAEYEAWQSRAG